jgi:membrane protein
MARLARMNSTQRPWEKLSARIPGGSVVLRAFEKSNEDHAKDMAASIAYFTFFSLFPLLVGVIAAASLFLDRSDIESRLDQMLADDFPGSADFLRTNIEALIELRGAVGMASVVALLWSASKMFGALSRGMNLALGIPKNHPFYLSKLRYFGMSLVVSLLLFVGVGFSTILDVVTQLDFARFGLDGAAFAWLGSHVASFVSILATAFLLYALVPYERPRWREILPASLVAAVLFEIGKSLFVLYVENANSLEAVYGSLASVIVLLLWLYFSSRVVLFGAELIAVRREEQARETAA